MPSTVMVSHCAPVVCQSMWGSMQAQGVKSTKCRHLTAQTPRWDTRTEKYTSIAKGTELHRNGPSFSGLQTGPLRTVPVQAAVRPSKLVR